MVEERDWVEEEGDEVAVERPLVAEWNDIDMDVEVGWVGLLPFEVVLVVVSLEWEEEGVAFVGGSGMVRMVSMKPWMRMLRWTWYGCRDDGAFAWLGEGDGAGTTDGDGFKDEDMLRLLPFETDDGLVFTADEPLSSFVGVDVEGSDSGVERKVG